MGLAHVIAGIGAGLLVGGPPGAVVGGVVGLLLAGRSDDVIGQTVYVEKPSISKAATATEVEAVVTQAAARGGTVAILSPDNTLGRLRAAIESFAVGAQGDPAAIDGWKQAALAALQKMTFVLMGEPGGFMAPVVWSKALADAAALNGPIAALRAASADAVAALTTMDQAKAKGLAEYDWS